jgi:hypothetical protein
LRKQKIDGRARNRKHAAFAEWISDRSAFGNPIRQQGRHASSNSLKSQKGSDFMSSIHNVCAEDLAKLFHHYHEALAHDFHGHASRQADISWEQAPQNERKLMIAAARLTLLELAATSEGEPSNRQYFAKPGEADWGC